MINTIHFKGNKLRNIAVNHRQVIVYFGNEKVGLFLADFSLPERVLYYFPEFKYFES